MLRKDEDRFVKSFTLPGTGDIEGPYSVSPERHFYTHKPSVASFWEEGKWGNGHGEEGCWSVVCGEIDSLSS